MGDHSAGLAGIRSTETWLAGTERKQGRDTSCAASCSGTPAVVQGACVPGMRHRVPAILTHVPNTGMTTSVSDRAFTGW